MKKLFTLFALVALAMTAMATEFTVFEGTETDQYVPVRSTYYDWAPYYSQVIYPAEEVAELQGKVITSVKFYVANENGITMSGGKLGLYIGTTTVSTYAWDPAYIEGLTKVAEISMNSGDPELIIDFTIPWTYEGDNLVLQTKVEEEGNYSDITYFYGVNSGIASSVYGGTYSVYTEMFYPKTTFTYVGGGEQTGLTLLSEANDQEANTEFTFDGDVVVTVQMGDYLFVRDNSGNGLIYGALDAIFEKGQVLNQGWSATKSSEDWTRFIDAAGVSASGETNAELAAPEVATTIDEDMLNSYVVYENVMFSMFQRHIKLENGDKIYYVNLFNLDMDGALFGYSGPFNAYGVIGKVDGELKFIPVLFEDYVEPQPEWELGDVNHDHAVDVSDVTILISYVLNGSADNFFDTEANLNGDNAIDVGDITALIALVLGGQN